MLLRNRSGSGAAEQAKIADPEEDTPEAAPGEEPEVPDQTGWRTIREGLRETGRGSGTIAQLRVDEDASDGPRVPRAHSGSRHGRWPCLAVVIALAAVASQVLQTSPAVVVATAGTCDDQRAARRSGDHVAGTEPLLRGGSELRRGQRADHGDVPSA